MLEFYFTVHCHRTNKSNSQSSTFETTHLKYFSLKTFDIHTNFKPFKFFNSFKPLEFVQLLSYVLYEIIARDGLHFTLIAIMFVTYYPPKEPLIFLFLRQGHSTPSLLNHPDTDLSQDFSFNSPISDFDIPFESFNPHTSIKSIAQPKSNLNSPLIIRIFLLPLLSMII